MWKPAIPILDPRAVAAKGYERTVEISTRTQEFNPNARAGVVVEDGEVIELVIAHGRFRPSVRPGSTLISDTAMLRQV